MPRRGYGIGLVQGWRLYEAVCNNLSVKTSNEMEVAHSESEIQRNRSFALSLCCRSAVALLSLCCRSAVALLSLCCRSAVALLSLCCQHALLSLHCKRLIQTPVGAASLCSTWDVIFSWRMAHRLHQQQKQKHSEQDPTCSHRNFRQSAPHRVNDHRGTRATSIFRRRVAHSLVNFFSELFRRVQSQVDRQPIAVHSHPHKNNLLSGCLADELVRLGVQELGSGFLGARRVNLGATDDGASAGDTGRALELLADTTFLAGGGLGPLVGGDAGKEINTALGGLDVLNANVDTLLLDAAVDDLVHNNTNRGVGDVEDDTGATVVELVGHSLLHGGVDLDVNVVSNLHEAVQHATPKRKQQDLSNERLRCGTILHGVQWRSLSSQPKVTSKDAELEKHTQDKDPCSG